MKNLREAPLLFNVGFFGIATLAAFYIVYESWHYGFFLTPFPTLLTIITLLFAGATACAIYVMQKGPSALYEPSVTISVKGERLIRFLALALPLPIISYAIMSCAVQNLHIGTRPWLAASVLYVDCERVLFGVKRADDRLAQLSSIYLKLDNNEIAQHYAELAVSNITPIPHILFGSSDSYKKRLVDRLDQLGTIYERQGKYSEALETWQRKHIAIHDLRWDAKEMKSHCSQTIAHQAYDHEQLGHVPKAQSLYSLAKRVGPAQCCNEAE
jgi:hypothetical protein